MSLDALAHDEHREKNCGWLPVPPFDCRRTCTSHKAALNERSAAQEHFIDLCRLLGEPTPAAADPAGERYCFERGARKDSGGGGWADVWKRGCFAWEYKGRRADLDAAFNQLWQYALALENPPLLIVSDMARFRIRTNWTNSVSVVHEFTPDDLADGAPPARRVRGACPRPVRGDVCRRPLGFESVAWFNGELFDDDTTLPLD